MAKFSARYEIDDGYAGGSRPQHFSINEFDLPDSDCSDEELVALFEEMMDQHFRERITPYAKNADQFVAWAREQFAAQQS